MCFLILATLPNTPDFVQIIRHGNNNIAPKETFFYFSTKNTYSGIWMPNLIFDPRLKIRMCIEMARLQWRIPPKLHSIYWSRINIRGHGNLGQRCAFLPDLVPAIYELTWRKLDTDARETNDNRALF